MVNTTKKMSDFDCYHLHSRACAAGVEAATQAVPPTMIVSQHANMLDDASPVVKQWVVPEGPCGFAWVNIKPGNGRFANWLKRQGIARRDGYYGGVSIWIHQFGQSITRKEAYAAAYARTVREAGVPAHSMSRMD